MKRLSQLILISLFVNALLLILFTGNILAAPHDGHTHNPFQVEANHQQHICPLKHQHAGGLCPHLKHGLKISGFIVSMECGGDPQAFVPQKNNARWAHSPYSIKIVAAFRSQLIPLPSFRWDFLFLSPVERPPEEPSFQI